ncbi:TrmH family RNA methyltransferase [Olsenella massiliensis]|uniref:TrmH family RNA methyltransferase n=1 Tax=Olsenella massiliensis TaxID=1622075 RepID=UPI00071DD05F|nr:RNA methyltransferase [Olsenella massiliensis]
MTTSRIENISDPRVRSYARLTSRQLQRRLEPDEGVVILESLLVIRTALREGVQVRSVLVDERHVEKLLADIPELDGSDVEVFCASRAVLSGICGFSVTRGYLAEARRPRPLPQERLLRAASRLVVLEGLTDVSNVGAAFRSAAALGADGVLLAPGCADPLNRRAVRVSMGTVFQLPWARAEGPWPQGAFAQMAGLGVWRVALALTPEAHPLGELSRLPQARGPMALVFGSEGAGLSSRTLSACDVHAVIPMAVGVDSLNVAASVAVACWELFGRPHAPASRP